MRARSTWRSISDGISASSVGEAPDFFVVLAGRGRAGRVVALTALELAAQLAHLALEVRDLRDERS